MKIFWDFKRAFFGLPFVLPLTRGIVLIPAAMAVFLWAFQYKLTSNTYFDEYSGEAREQVRPKLGQL